MAAHQQTSTFGTVDLFDANCALMADTEPLRHVKKLVGEVLARYSVVVDEFQLLPVHLDRVPLTPARAGRHFFL